MAKPKIYMDETRLPKTCCPWCWTLLDSASNVYAPGPPQPGDFTICIHCTAVLKYTATMQLEASSLSEIPIELRSKFAHVKMVIGEARDAWNKLGGKPWTKQ